MTFISGIFSYISTRSTKSNGISSVIKRQQHNITTNLSTSITSSNNNQQENNKDVVTESAILNRFPRPNLKPTLTFKQTIFNQCSNCSGPHSTHFCPC
ncbi:hypothetical protein BDB01DRAFT_796826 [Pilobolus umbonatus]|nr:hypothetical protein BDB01DRAFT_796826 [Pilobolus umbonatus]